VTVDGTSEVLNEQYAVKCAEGVIDVGVPLVTQVTSGGNWIYLPVIMKNAQ
jgi:hypothetical protein